MLFSSLFEKLKGREPLPPLFPREVWSPDISAQIARATNVELFGGARDVEMAGCCRAGLLVWNDDLGAAHELAQTLDTPTGSLWHAVIHRREGDPSNARYWWRRTGTHPALADVFTEAMSVLENEKDPGASEFRDTLHRSGHWDPSKFVQLCDDHWADAPHWLLRLQRAEIIALLCWNREQIYRGADVN